MLLLRSLGQVKRICSGAKHIRRRVKVRHKLNKEIKRKKEKESTQKHRKGETRHLKRMNYYEVRMQINMHKNARQSSSITEAERGC